MDRATAACPGSLRPGPTSRTTGGPAPPVSARRPGQRRRQQNNRQAGAERSDDVTTTIQPACRLIIRLLQSTRCKLEAEPPGPTTQGFRPSRPPPARRPKGFDGLGACPSPSAAAVARSAHPRDVPERGRASTAQGSGETRPMDGTPSNWADCGRRLRRGRVYRSGLPRSVRVRSRCPPVFHGQLTSYLWPHIVP